MIAHSDVYQSQVLATNRLLCFFIEMKSLSVIMRFDLEFVSTDNYLSTFKMPNTFPSDFIIFSDSQFYIF